MISYICESILLVLIVFHYLKAFFSKDKSRIWSPLSTISFTYLYYCSMPFWLGTIEQYAINEELFNGHIFHFASLLSYCVILIGYNRPTNSNFHKWNSYFTDKNASKFGLALFLIAMVCYVPFRGLHLSIYGTPLESKLASGGLIYYFIFMTNMFAVASALILIGLKKNKKNILLIFVLWLILIQIIFAGARWLIIVTLITFLTTYYLYPKAKRINVPVMAALLVVVYFGFSIMDLSRQRGAGINIEVAKALSFDDVKDGAKENYGVYWFSLMAMNRLNETGERVYFQPFITAALMPIPRSIFPWKPKDGYLDKIETEIFGNALGGAAFLNYVEYYMAFGWIGIIVMSWIIGWIARRFWDNYKNNPHSIGAIIALGAFSAVTYSIISRGYLASTLTNVVLVVFLPFWLSGYLKKHIR